MKSLLTIKPNVTVRSAMKQMDKNGMKIVFAVDKKKTLIGTLTDGDIRRWILARGNLNESVEKVLNYKPVKISEPVSIEDVKKLMLSKHLEWIPVVDQNNVFKDLLTWEQVFSGNIVVAKRALQVPVVIMAGGQGERLDPFTKVLPKALIPINDEPMIEIIMKRFGSHGIRSFYVCVHHKAKMIKAYFEDIKSYKVNFITEKYPLGTAGALRMLRHKIKGDCFLTNCDALIEADYKDMLDFHKKRDYALTIVSSCKHFIVPYGVCHLEKNGELAHMEEKPEHSHLVNTGMYVISRRALAYIPAVRPGQMFHMTDFIEILRQNGEKIGVYPVGESAWIDTGEWPEFKKALLRLQI